MQYGMYPLQKHGVAEALPYPAAIDVDSRYGRCPRSLVSRKKRKTNQPATHANVANHARQICNGGSIRPYSK